MNSMAPARRATYVVSAPRLGIDRRLSHQPLDDLPGHILRARPLIDGDATVVAASVG